jgi:hypothetical protein
MSISNINFPGVIVPSVETPLFSGIPEVGSGEVLNQVSQIKTPSVGMTEQEKNEFDAKQKYLEWLSKNPQASWSSDF